MEIQLITPFGAVGRNVVSLVLESGPFAKFIILIISVISVISWAIIYDRARLYMKLRKGGARLQSALANNGLGISMDTVQKSLPSIEGGLVMETKRFLDGRKTAAAGSGRRSEDKGTSPLGHLRDLLDRKAVTEISEMEKYLIFLATTASVSPFLGLLGTVWGIMSSFLSMGVDGTASIEVVGPGIAEALVTTIWGLGAAISALVGYNLLIRHVRRQETLIELFISRLITLTSEQIESRSFVKPEVPKYEEKSV